jgi:FkbH-like protein
LTRVEAADFCAPKDLEVTAIASPRVLAIGSCFLEGLLGGRVADQAGLRIDFHLVTHLPRFPQRPPAPMEEYDSQLIQVPLRAVMNDATFAHFDYNDLPSYEAAFEHSKEQLSQQLRGRMKWNLEHGTPTFVMNFMTPQFPGMGRFFPRFDLRNIEYYVTCLNQELERLAATYRSTYILDVDRISGSMGRRHIQDDSICVFGHNAIARGGHSLPERLEPLGTLGEYYDMAPGVPFGHAVLAELRAMHRTLRQVDTVKLVVVDLDDTLWNGVSADSAEIGQQMTEGWPLGVAEALQYLRKRGILLAIISKNDEANIREIWKKLFRERLYLSDFSAVRINWRPKHENMSEILRAVDLLPANVVFIDDNPAERAQMQAVFPAMRTIGANPFHIRRILLLAPETQTLGVTAESAQRTAMVQAQIKREADRESLSLEAFKTQQEVRLSLLRMTEIGHPRFARAFELLNKTNQFNTTGRRWTEPEIDGFLAAGGVIAAYEVEDRYTAYGLVGVVLLHGRRIVQWVMSCRVIGLGAEYATMGELVAEMRGGRDVPITANLIETGLNGPCLGFFQDAGFVRRRGTWMLAPDGQPRIAEHVTIERKEAVLF